MSCADFERQIASYVGGELDWRDAALVERHVSACAACAELTQALQQDRELLAMRPPEVAQLDYVAMRRRIRQEIARPRRRWLPALLAAAAALLLAVVWVATKRPAAMVADPPISEAAPATVLSQPIVDRKRPVRLAKRPATIQTEPQPEITLEAAIRMFQDLTQTRPAPPPSVDSPVEMEIATRDPGVTIILVSETNGDSQ